MKDEISGRGSGKGTSLFLNSSDIFWPAALDKEMRPWDTYVSLEATVKNMLTSLRAVGELQNPAIRERHWRQLMNSTKVSPGFAERAFNSFSHDTCKLNDIFYFRQLKDIDS